ncbi:glycosyltransferase family 39 protein [Candidatus Microgenomates bacterium]|nr:glycosyltransferase family 39 protein [Candidatus Microgenomates bacterium]
MNQLTVSLWGDEAFASILAQKSLADIVTIVARDTSPPLHYILLHFWMQIFGTSEIAIRSFPLLLFVLLAFVVHKLAEELFGKRAGVFAFFLTLLNPFLFIYAFEARMYMLLALTSTASMWFFVTKRWKLYILLTTAALYTHHFSVFIILVQVLYSSLNILPVIRQEIAKPWKLIIGLLKSSFVRSLTAIFILYAPWLPSLYGQTSMVGGDFWLPRPKADDLWKLYSHFIAGSSNLPVELWVMSAGLLLLLLRGFQKGKDVLIYLWLFLPAILTYLASQFGRPLFFDRYLIVSTAAIPLLLASPPLKKISTILVLTIIAGLALINIYSFQRPVKQPFREVASFVSARYGKDKMVINYYTNALHYFELKHYQTNVKIYSPSGPLPFWVGTALIDPKDVLTQLPPEKTLLVMASGDINRVAISGYGEIRRERFRDLYLLWFAAR